MNRMQRWRWRVAAGMLVLAMLVSPSVWAANTKIQVFVDGKRLALASNEAIINNGTTLVGFRALFEALGFNVKWDAGSKQVTGTREGLTIQLKINSTAAAVNGKQVTLAQAPQVNHGKTLVPLRFVSEYSGKEVSFSNSGGTATIQVGTGAGPVVPGGGGNSGTAEPYVVKGLVLDGDGTPLKGAIITVDNQLLYNSNLEVVTGADGRYRIELPKAAATYKVYGKYRMEHNGEIYVAELEAQNEDPFAGNEGAVRNFKFQSDDNTTSGGFVGFVLFYMMDLIHPLNPVADPPDRDDVIITMTPVGKLVNGATGREIVTRGKNSNNGYGVHDVPVGRYKISAVYAPPGEEPSQMLIRTVTRGMDLEYFYELELDFNSVLGNIYSLELELKLDVEKPPPPSYDPKDWSWDLPEDDNWDWVNPYNY